MDLEAIPGVGEKTADALSALEDPERAIREGDVLAISSAPGISPGQAARIARGAIRREHDDPGGFLATDRAREIHQELLELLQRRTVTDYAAARLETFYPSTRPSRIAEVRSFARRAMARAPDPEVLERLEGVEPLAEPRDVRVRDRCLATTDAETYAEARAAVPELSVELVEDARDLADLARGYATVVALDETFAGVDVEGDVRVEPDALDDPASVVPERPLAFFARNRERLRAAIAVHRAVDVESGEHPGDPATEAGQLGDGAGGDDVAFDEDSLSTLESALGRLDEDGEVAGDEELDRLTVAVDDLDAAVSTAESVANDRLREAIREQDVTIEGADLLSLVEQGAGVDSLLQRELADEYADAIAGAREHVVDALALDPGEAEIAERAFQEAPTFPVTHEERAVSRLREELVAARERRAGRLKRDLAGHRELATSLVRAALELDVELAIARFARDNGCTMPTFVDEGVLSLEGGADSEVPSDTVGTADDGGGTADEDVGFAIEGGRSPLLPEPIEDVEPVDYAVSGVALLSGVNSGGKTSTLDLVAAVVVLAHMGLPVPAEAVRLRRFEDLHYHAKTQGTLDAGAFESTVRQFAGLATGGDGSLVLVDELESITEPGASAKIIAGILEALSANGSTAVVVSHLAGEIREMAEDDVAVDGIEAVGLEDGELVVERSPVKDHLARSTPELIVEKLAGEAGDGDDVGFYERLLEKFE